MDEALAEPAAPATAFAAYSPQHRAACLALFDANCPAFFAPNERADYEAFLDRARDAYTVVIAGEETVGAFGLMPAGGPGRAHLNWILIDPRRQGAGLGRTIMADVARQARDRQVATVDIAASQHSAPFFAKFGAVETAFTSDGWGPGMHRADMVWRVEGANHPA